MDYWFQPIGWGLRSEARDCCDVRMLRMLGLNGSVNYNLSRWSSDLVLWLMNRYWTQWTTGRLHERIDSMTVNSQDRKNRMYGQIKSVNEQIEWADRMNTEQIVWTDETMRLNRLLDEQIVWTGEHFVWESEQIEWTGCMNGLWYEQNERTDEQIVWTDEQIEWTEFRKEWNSTKSTIWKFQISPVVSSVASPRGGWPQWRQLLFLWFKNHPSIVVMLTVIC